ncbi:multidrug efflux system protein [Beijerinckiaceae bacterium RH AL1]|nr:multidrug efflux RND transporter permease subunit [Beijerinckiaceae bacterium]VVB49769.1 multidrug efflux system protein [Beijerinckiaceae bacterium RH CH11]VVB49846.1 multidrug efflux system protein [Beijerinckiaceae bacterium RH AL8]VVC57067.1 multidrug efflux system protein [Beijerinckiaceae bacterium RH AL1]
MKLSHFFIDHPIFAMVVSLFITIIGGVAYIALPIAQYPEIAPPTIQITTQYPGASAATVAETVSTPLEEQINGVENMLYFSSQSTGDGNLLLTVTFKLGTDLNTAQVLTQNRVAIATPRLPDVVQRLGVTVKKSSPDLMMVIHLLSPDNSRDQLYMSNYATLHLRDELLRVEGVGDAQVFGNHDYAMRIWLDPDKAASRNLTAEEIIAALQAQNVQVSGGILNQPPVPKPGAFQLNVKALGRLSDPSQFADILLKADAQGRVTRVRDIGWVELGGENYGANGYLDGVSAVPILIYQQPGTNALAMATRVKAAMAKMSKQFPQGLKYDIIYDTTTFIAQSVAEVVRTIIEAVGLVVVVVILFLQTWRASVIPIVAIPISLIGTFTVLAAFGLSLNNLSLFGLVLAVGIVVDDAIVVVENVERNLRLGLSPREAAHRTMDEVGGALIAIALTLCAVFVPSAFISGISGQFFRQFAVTIAASTIVSAFVSLTLSPALCALLFKPHEETHVGRAPLIARPVVWFFDRFNRTFEWLSNGYGRMVGRLLRVGTLMLVVYAGLIALTGVQFVRAPTGFIPDQDLGYLISIYQLPPGASLQRTDEVIREATERLKKVPGVANEVAFAGFDGATFTQASNAGAIFVNLKSFEERDKQGLTAPVVLQKVNQALAGIQGAFIIAIPPPPVPGLGTAGGFKMMLEDQRNLGPHALQAAAWDLIGAAMQVPGMAQLFTPFTTGTPSIYADIDRERAEKLGVSPSAIFNAMQLYLGSAYINDVNYLGRTYEVLAQADGRFRNTTEDIAHLKTRNAAGQMVPISAVAQMRRTSDPYRVPRYNLYPAAEVQGGTLPGYASSYGLAVMSKLAAERLPQGMSFEWTDLAYQQTTAGNTTLIIFGASVFFVFLVLAAQYESWSLPLSVVLIVPMCLLAAVTGLMYRMMNVDILAQIGFTVLVGLAAKNAILIVEFAKQSEEAGASARDAAIQAGRTRLRPILMTSFAFILGVVPLLIASGAGAEMRQTLGTTVFFGMLGVTAFGLIFTPIFFVAVHRIFGRPKSIHVPSERSLPSRA